MTRTSLLTLLLAAVACGPTTPRTMPGAIRPPSVTPEPIVAPSVPTLEGMPVAVRIGLTVYISGMVPVDSAGRIVGTDLGAQTQQALRNLVTVVRAARGLPGDVVRLTVYVRDPSAESVAVVRRTILAELGTESPPALTIVGMSGLPEPAMQVLLEGIAQLRSEFPDRERMRN
jgi:2-iminobutanoate/2-iminopropanoate deaminase